MAKWFYLTDGQPAGPVDSAALKQLATSGRLKPNDKVRREDMQEWYEAKQVKGLFSLAQSHSNPPATAPSVKRKKSESNSTPRPKSESGASPSTWTGVRELASDLHNWRRTESFWEWYSRGIGQQSAVVQGLLWVCYGFIWIPSYWAITKNREPRTTASAATLGPSCLHCGISIDNRDATGGDECPYCGRRTTSSPVRLNGHICSKCGGNDIKSFEYVHALGKTHRTASLSIGGGSLTSLVGASVGPLASIAGAQAAGRMGTVTGLAQLCAPPEKAKWALSAERQDYNERVYPKRFAVWRRSWICMTCGTHWVAGD
jgi:GYF domain 2